MVTSVATGLIALCAVLAGWVTVQIAWRRAFPAAGGDPDALAGRLGCRGDCAPDDCARRCPEGSPGRAGEDDQ